MESDKHAKQIVGFNHKNTKEDYFNYLKKNTLIIVLNTEEVKRGDVFHIPAARVSAIRAGVLLA